MHARSRFWLTMGTHTAMATGTYLLGKAASVAFPVLVLGFVRFAISAIGFGLIVRLGRLDLRTPWREDWKAFLLAGFTGVLLNQIGFLWALKYTLPSHAALIYALTPTVVLLLGWARGSERPTLRKVCGIALAFSGVAVLFSDRAATGLPPTWIKGDLFMLLALVSWAAYSVISRPLVLRHGSVRSTALSILVGSAMFLPLGALGLIGFHPSAIPLNAWAGAAYLGLVTSLAMYLLWFRALGMAEPSRVALAANFQPIATAGAAWLFLGQAITPTFGVGAVLVVAGVLLTQLSGGTATGGPPARR